MPAAQPLLHVASQLHEFEQSMPPPHPDTSHVAVHEPVPQWIPAPHAAFIVQLAVQSPPPEQSMPLPHAPLL